MLLTIGLYISSKTLVNIPHLCALVLNNQYHQVVKPVLECDLGMKLNFLVSSFLCSLLAGKSHVEYEYFLTCIAQVAQSIDFLHCWFVCSHSEMC